MSTLYLGADQEALAEKLGSLVDQAVRSGDLFAPVRIVVPNRYLARWLRLWLARRHGVTINVSIEYLLEKAMWELLCGLDGREHAAPLKQINDEGYRLMLLAALLDDNAGPSDPVVGYLGGSRSERRRDFWRRVWQLTGRLAGLLRDYEYHRHDRLILKWLGRQDGYPGAPAGELKLERSQRDLFERVIREPDGLRVRLGRADNALCKTLPQYACEMLELPSRSLRHSERARAVHLFGLGQISALHAHTLRWLGEHYDLHLYHINPLVGRLTALPGTPAAAAQVLQQLAERFRGSAGIGEQPGDGLLAPWGRAGAESLWLMAELLKGKASFHAQLVPGALDRASRPTVLNRLQDDLQGRPAPREPLAQDVSVQLVACPGMYREIETVYQSILHNLDKDRTLKQTDIAVLATDMSRYRPAIQAVFERRTEGILYNLADYSAAELSPFGHALLGLLDLALESFSSSRVFAVLLNPCFLARLGAEREQALVWLQWAEALGIYNGWDRKDKAERGYADSSFYCWQLGLRRLRLGRLMEVADEQLDAPAPRYQEVIPFADLASNDNDQLDAFVRAIERLLPRLVRLRSKSLSGARWAQELRRLVEDFLAVPPDQPREADVRDALLGTLENLALLDALGAPRSGGLPLALVREFVEENLETLRTTAGEFLTGGVTIAALQPVLPIPFRIVYVLGLGEGLFPGTDLLPSLDLRSRERCPGDIRPAEMNQFLFLQALLAARDKVYLLYNCRDLQKDQDLHPCSPLNQLQRYLEEHVLKGRKLVRMEMPLLGSDLQFLNPDAPGPSDCRVNYSTNERLLGIDEARKAGVLRLDERQTEEVERRLRQAEHRFSLPAGPPSGLPGVPTVTLPELRNFLRCPVEAALKRHLRLADEDEVEPADDEPFYTCYPQDYRLITEVLKRFITRSVDTSLTEALAGWRSRFADLHEEWRLRGRVPEGAFGKVDLARFEQALALRIESPGGLAAFLRERQGVAFCGPLLLGESPAPVGARQRFPALELTLREQANGSLPSQVRLVGMLPFAWRSREALEVLVITNSGSKKVPEKHLSMPLLEPVLFLLALRAAIPSQEWLGEREFRIHVAHQDGLVGFAYGADDVAPGEARDYLVQLVEDYLDRGGFDLLPFELAMADEKLRAAYLARDDANYLASTRIALDGLEGEERAKAIRLDYVRCLEEAIADDAQSRHPVYRRMKLLEIVEAQVPADAFDKIRCRFRLLDRGPARSREPGEGRKRVRH